MYYPCRSISMFAGLMGVGKFSLRCSKTRKTNNGSSHIWLLRLIHLPQHGSCLSLTSRTSRPENSYINNSAGLRCIWMYHATTLVLLIFLHFFCSSGIENLWLFKLSFDLNHYNNFVVCYRRLFRIFFFVKDYP